MKSEQVEYHHAGSTLEGFVAYEEGREKRPGVLIFHAWGGRDAFVCEKAEWLASLGYVGFAVDLYGKGVLGSSVEENTQLMTPFMEDRKFLRERMLVALETAKSHRAVDGKKMGAMGFCFGGLCALDLARSGAPVQGVVSLHGLLSPIDGVKSERIGAKVLVLHGHDDPMVPPEQVLAFEEEMTAAQVDWQVHVYGGTKHAFTNPVADDANLGIKYNPLAEKRALQSTETFLHGLFHQE